MVIEMRACGSLAAKYVHVVYQHIQCNWLHRVLRLRQSHTCSYRFSCETCANYIRSGARRP